MKSPVIGYDALLDAWCVRHNGLAEIVTARQLAFMYGINNPVLYCRQQYDNRHAKPAGDVK